jgi:transposase
MKKKQRKQKKKQQSPRRLDVTPEALQQLVDCAKDLLPQQQFELLSAITESILFLRAAYEQKRISERNLLRMMFGPFTESARVILQEEKEREEEKRDKKEKPKGHGRNGVEDYPGARRQKVPHTEMKAGQQCPECLRGTLYQFRGKEPAVLVRFTASIPVDATVYEIERLRCSACQKIYSAPLPVEAQKPKYDETVGAMIGVLRYGAGLPMNRIETLQQDFGIPLPSSTQWAIVDRMAEVISPAYEELARLGAQGEVIHNDDTSMGVLALCKIRQQQRQEAEEEDEAGNNQKNSRTGCFTSGFVCLTDGRRIALFFTGEHHAGENMEALLQKRKQDLAPPIQMCDGLSRNLPKSFQTILGNCVSHGRRHFVDVFEDFPEECRFVIETLKEVFKNEDIALQANMTPAERLLFHQSQSKPWMDKLNKWLDEQFEQKKVEPNSGLGKAISYMRKHWEPLTLFLKIENAPLHNNIAERALKMAVLHRKNSMFFKTFRGAHVGDALMSLIHTCRLSNANPFEYLVALQLHREQLKANPQQWMPWNYRATIDEAARASPTM